MIPIFDLPRSDDKDLSRFLGKVSLEVLAYITSHIESSNEEIVSEIAFDRLRHYVRYGGKPLFWGYTVRRVYEENEVLHAFQLKWTPDGDLLLILEILGIEYAMSLTNPDHNSFKDWLFLYSVH